MMALTWKRKTEQYTNGERGYCGKVAFFSVDWDSSKRPEGPYKLSTRLPGLLDNPKYYLTPEAAKAKAEKLLVAWLAATGLRRETKGEEKCTT